MSPSELRAPLEKIIQEAAEILYHQDRANLNIEVKSRNSLVTKIDKELEQFLVSQLSNLLPEAGFIAEEGTSDKVGAKYDWIIDPLDGTTNFIHGIPAYCISVALAGKTDILLGGIYEFNSREYFDAVRGEGACLNGKPITVSRAQSAAESLLATGFPYYDFQYMDAYLGFFKEFMHASRGIRRLGSAALDLAYVACGRFEGFFEYSLHPWDVAAGALIVEEAGGAVTDFSGDSDFLYGKQIIASNRQIHSELLTIIARHFKAS